MKTLAQSTCLLLNKAKLESKDHVTTRERLLLATQMGIYTKAAMLKASEREEAFIGLLQLETNMKAPGFKTRSMDLAR